MILTIKQNNRFPVNAPIGLKDPAHDNSSTVSGPDSIGVSNDCSNDIPIVNHTHPNPVHSKSKFAERN